MVVGTARKHLVSDFSKYLVCQTTYFQGSYMSNDVKLMTLNTEQLTIPLCRKILMPSHDMMTILQ